MSRAVRFSETGGPEVLKIVEVSTPEPGPGEVRIKVKAIGLNRAEVMYRSGAYLLEPHYPAQLGYEAAGEIDAVGPGVNGFGRGDKVSVIPAFSFAEYGLYGEVVLAPARATVKHPESLSWEEAASTWMQYVTVWGGVIDIAKLGRGDMLLIPAASSSVGLAAIQVARRVGAQPVALTRTSSKAALLKEAGASHVIATEEQDLVEEVKKLTGGKGARVVFDPVGGATFEKLAKATAKGGILLLYGALGAGQPTTIPLLETLGNHLTIRGYELFEVTSDDAKLEEVKRFVTSGLASGDFRPLIAKTFPFDSIVEAHRYLESNAQVGKVVVTV
ncbi:MAG: zinc-dependent alcohol dehydrogenase family protein [Burkholderiales bacterium]|nr:zinc-dependent alcohol dehydrogenase family protein [Burkholderiales bacterium]